MIAYSGSSKGETDPSPMGPPASVEAAGSRGPERRSLTCITRPYGGCAGGDGRDAFLAAVRGPGSARVAAARAQAPRRTQARELGLAQLITIGASAPSGASPGVPSQPLCCLAGGRAGEMLVDVFVDEGQEVLAAGECLLGFDFGAEPGNGYA